MNPADSRTFDNLALLYQGLLVTIVRVRCGEPAITEYPGFRRQTKDLMAKVIKQAGHSGYPEADVRNTNYAIIAFLDESILDSSDPRRYEWDSLQSELYETAVAGEKFFQDLDALGNRRESHVEADILEVYYLCLLLGYRGRYAGDTREQLAELRHYQENLRTRIEAARGRNIVLWPGEGPSLPDKPSGPTVEDRLYRRLRLWAVASVAAVPVLWLLCRVGLSYQASGVQAGLIP